MEKLNNVERKVKSILERVDEYYLEGGQAEWSNLKQEVEEVVYELEECKLEIKQLKGIT